MKTYINKITLLYAVMQGNQVKDYKQGLTHTINEWYEGSDANKHYAEKFKCDEVFIRGFNDELEVVLKKTKLVLVNKKKRKKKLIKIMNLNKNKNK
jgi:hypothetical protein